MVFPRFLFLIFHLPCLSASPSLLLLTSDETPPELLSSVSPGLLSTHSLALCRSNLTLLAASLTTVTAVIDATYSPLETESIAGLCQEYEVPHLVLGYAGDTAAHRWTFYVNRRQQELAAGLEAVMTHFRWGRASVVTDTNGQLKETDRRLSGSLSSSYQRITFPLRDEASIEKTVGRVMRMTGNRVTVFLTLPELTEKIVDQQERKHISGTGYGNLMPLLSSLYDINSESVAGLLTGNVILAEEELAETATREAYYSTILTEAAAVCGNYSDNFALLQALEAKYPSHSREGPFRLVNMRSGRRVSVGRVANRTVTITDTVYFLGNSTAVPVNAKISLAISGNFGVGNVNGLILTSVAYYYGAMLAIESINARSDVLENFYMELFNFTAGVTQWNYDYAYKSVYPNRDRLGLAVLTGISSGVTIHLIGFLREIGFAGPVVGSFNTVNSLSSRKEFPEYVRTVLPNSYITRVYVQMFKHFRWTKCGLFVSNETWGLTFQRDFARLAGENNITIVNAPQHQVLPNPIPSVSALHPYQASFLNFTETKVRILIVVVINNAICVVDYLYELGMRAGDVQIVANEWMSLPVIFANDTDLSHKRSELMRGAIQFTPISYVAQLGISIRNEYIQKYAVAPPTFACFYYDSTVALAYALDLVVRAGQDYMNSTVLLKALRGSRFVGCSGTVTFDPDTNDRSPMPYDIQNAQFSGNDSFVTNITTVGKYDPTSSTLFSFYSDIIWCDGTTTVPKDRRQSTIGCPFEDKYRQDFPSGRYALYGVVAALTLLSAAFSIACWKLLWRRPLVRLTENREIQVEDVVVMVGIAVEAIQYISIGPDLQYLTKPVKGIASIYAFDFEGVFDYKNGGFTLVWLEVFSLTLLWVALCIAAVFRIDERLKCAPGCSQIYEFLIPLIADWLFVPILSVLLDVFSCTEGIGLTQAEVSFASSYLHKDCYMACWRGNHILFAIGSAVILFIFIGFAAVAKPLFQETQISVNIKTSTLFLTVKSIAQTTLIAVGKSVTDTNAHFASVLSVILLFFIFSVKHNCFGYQRTRFWHSLSLLAVLWTVFVALIQHLATSTDYNQPFLIAAGVGWGLLFCFGVVYQRFKLPSLLHRKPGVNTQVLFRFAFSPITSTMISAINADFRKVGNKSLISSRRLRRSNKVEISPEDVQVEMRSTGNARGDLLSSEES